MSKWRAARGRISMVRAGTPMLIRPVRETDQDSWERMREALWPSGPDAPKREHAREIERYFSGALSEPVEVLLAFDDDGNASGFIELSIRPYAEGCSTDHVAYVEGWYVVPAVRRQGVGAALMRAAESWARSQGSTELASDTEADNLVSRKAHTALGFVETALIRCFRKSV